MGALASHECVYCCIAAAAHRRADGQASRACGIPARRGQVARRVWSLPVSDGAAAIRRRQGKAAVVPHKIGPLLPLSLHPAGQCAS